MELVTGPEHLKVYDRCDVVLVSAPWLLLVSLPSFSAGIWGFPHRLNSTEVLFVAHNALLLLLEAWLRDRLSSAARPHLIPSCSLHLSTINGPLRVHLFC